MLGFKHTSMNSMYTDINECNILHRYPRNIDTKLAGTSEKEEIVMRLCTSERFVYMKKS